MSERAEREFNEWKEKYEIPYSMEFQVKTLIKLQEEYDTIVPAENNTKTRQTLLDMINRVWGSLRLTPKDRKYSEIETKIYNVWIKITNPKDKDIFISNLEKLISQNGKYNSSSI